MSRNNYFKVLTLQQYNEQKKIVGCQIMTVMLNIPHANATHSTFKTCIWCIYHQFTLDYTDFSCSVSFSFFYLLKFIRNWEKFCIILYNFLGQKWGRKRKTFATLPQRPPYSGIYIYVSLYVGVAIVATTVVI